MKQIVLQFHKICSFQLNFQLFRSSNTKDYIFVSLVQLLAKFGAFIAFIQPSDKEHKNLPLVYLLFRLLFLSFAVVCISLKRSLFIFVCLLFISVFLALYWILPSFCCGSDGVRKSSRTRRVTSGLL